MTHGRRLSPLARLKRARDLALWACLAESVVMALLLVAVLVGEL